jgi:hypothetical protein
MSKFLKINFIMLAVIQVSCFGMKRQNTMETNLIKKEAPVPRANVLTSMPHDIMWTNVIKPEKILFSISEHCKHEVLLSECILLLRATCKTLNAVYTLPDLNAFLKDKNMHEYFKQIPSTLAEKRAKIDTLLARDPSAMRPSCINLSQQFENAEYLYGKTDQKLKVQRLLVLELLENDVNSASNSYIKYMLQSAIAGNAYKFALDLVSARPQGLVGEKAIYEKKIKQFFQDYLENKILMYEYRSTEEKATFVSDLRSCL